MAHRYTIKKVWSMHRKAYDEILWSGDDVLDAIAMAHDIARNAPGEAVKVDYNGELYYRLIYDDDTTRRSVPL